MALNRLLAIVIGLTCTACSVLPQAPLPTPQPAPVPTVAASCATSDGTPVTVAFAPYITRWSDAVVIADSTARINLYGPVSQLQAIRRDVSGFAWPPCAVRAADLLVLGMNSEIEGYLEFMASPNPDDTRDVPSLGKITYANLVKYVGQTQADSLWFAESTAAITLGRQYFGEFADELAYATGEKTRPAGTQ